MICRHNNGPCLKLQNLWICYLTCEKVLCRCDKECGPWVGGLSGNPNLTKWVLKSNWVRKEWDKRRRKDRFKALEGLSLSFLALKMEERVMSQRMQETSGIWEQLLVGGQKENRISVLTIARNWILPTMLMNKDQISPLEPPARNVACWPLGFSSLRPMWDLQNFKVINLCCWNC